MGFKVIKSLVCFLAVANFSITASAQAGLCPDNLDFEFGNFTNWVCRWGTVSVVGGINTVSLPNIGQVPGRHDIITAATAGTDIYGGFSENCPNGSQYSVKLGNSLVGAQAESISYTYTIPAAATVFSILFHYAVVLQNPSHTPEEQPRFRARIIDLSTNTPIPCVTFDFTASSSLPGFRPSAIDPNVLYKDWTPVSINLSGLAGKTIMLEFITSDCTRGGHFGYAYMDVNTTCNGVISGNNICPGDTAITITAPFGFQSYAWYSDNTFTQILSTSQTLYLNPLPSVGSVYPVIVTPYPAFGCVDTLYATISVATSPVSNAGPDKSICQSQQVQIGAPPTPAYTYEWTPANQVSNPNIPDPFAWTITPNPTEFIVKTTDILTGCHSYDTTIISTFEVDTAIRLSGKNDFCIGDPSAGNLSVSNSIAAVQWFDSNGPIPGATSLTYQPTLTGSYWAEVIQNGCTDSTANVSFAIRPLPQASFYPNSDTGCVTNNSFLFTNTSTVSDGSAMSYVWKFSDGSSQQVTDATKTFLNTGNYTVQLITTTSSGCKDSTLQTVTIFPNGVPNFLWDSICTNRPVLFKNLSNENGSVQAGYNWDFNNGTVSLLKDPLPVVYTTAGATDVTLEITTVGCENDPKSVTKKVLVNAAAPGIRYGDITVPLGSARFINVRGNVGNIYSWLPQTQLSSYSTRYTEFYATTDDVKYLIGITDKHTCITTDTMQILVLKKPGFYLPTAFTPNGDGLNDVAKPYLVGMKALKSFSVYNRWGNLVFHTTTYGEGWDGKYKGLDQNAGVYVWILEFITNDNKPVTEKGTITVIR